MTVWFTGLHHIHEAWEDKHFKWPHTWGEIRSSRKNENGCKDGKAEEPGEREHKACCTNNSLCSMSVNAIRGIKINGFKFNGAEAGF